MWTSNPSINLENKELQLENGASYPVKVICQNMAQEKNSTCSVDASQVPLFAYDCYSE